VKHFQFLASMSVSIQNASSGVDVAAQVNCRLCQGILGFFSFGFSFVV
jgi:hypothetical protein